MDRFSLPVMKPDQSRSPADLIRRTTQLDEVYESQLGDKASFEFGIAILGDQYPILHMANQVRGIRVPDHMTPEDVIAAVEDTFAIRKLRCHRWQGDEGVTPPELIPLLEQRGYMTTTTEVWALQQLQPAAPRTDLAVIPGRASFRGVAAVMQTVTTEKHGTEVGTAFAAAAAQLLDESTVESLLAIHDTTPVGLINMVIEGQFAYIADIMVTPPHRRQAVATTLMTHALDLCARSRAAAVTLCCDPANTPATTLYRRLGFTPIGQLQAMVTRH